MPRQNKETVNMLCNSRPGERRSKGKAQARVGLHFTAYQTLKPLYPVKMLHMN